MKPTRRDFVVRSTALLVGGIAVGAAGRRAAAADDPGGPFLATGTRVGEMTDTSAVVWVRLTRMPTRVAQGGGPDSPTDKAGRRQAEDAMPDAAVEQLEGACPAAAGRVRIRYGTREDLSDARDTEVVSVDASSDGIATFALQGLRPGTRYVYACQTAGPGQEPRDSGFRGGFETAPAAQTTGSLRFCVMTCQGYTDRGHADGHGIYPAMLALSPQFACLTGDLVYYDNDEPRAVTARLARYHWERMFSLPRLLAFNRQVGAYWLKDDHDTLKNDSWPGSRMGSFTFAEGQRIFRQQAPMPSDALAYRTVRWGRDLQVWFTDGRDFRSPNTQPDGPDKTIWGAEQKAWFKRTVQESDATWKVLVSPTPLVGPDRASGKNDNHANAGFMHEGDEIRRWIQSNAGPGFFVICGDRHWQYHSVHPDTGVQEFGVGAASDEHAGGSPGYQPRVHRFHRMKGGFLSVTLDRDGARRSIRFELRDVAGEVVYTFTSQRDV